MFKNHVPDTLYYLLAIATIAMIVLLGGVVFFVILYQRRIIAHQLEIKRINDEKELELIQASIQSEEQERMRIASELHDDVAATLSSARLFLYKTKDAIYDENVINQSKQLLDESLQKIRNISHKLQPAFLQHLGLQLALQAIIETVNKSGIISTKFVTHAALPRTSENVELAAYRISQELIANIIKHSEATSIKVDADFTEKRIILLFTHDGTGLTQEKYETYIYKKGSIGLKNIVNRLKSVNGSIRFFLEPGAGYKTELIIPLKTET